MRSLDRQDADDMSLSFKAIQLKEDKNKTSRMYGVTDDDGGDDDGDDSNTDDAMMIMVSTALPPC